MKKELIIEKLKLAHEELWKSGIEIPEALQNTQQNGKWSAAQNLQHINKSITQFSKYLRVPKSVIKDKFGLSERPSGDFDTVYANYEEQMKKGAVSPAPFIPEDVISIDMKEEVDKGKQIIEGMISALNDWTEEELDQYNCPHPLLGKLSAREMLYFIIFHAYHHHNSVHKILISL
jgi:hypothetical protein